MSDRKMSLAMRAASIPGVTLSGYVPLPVSIADLEAELDVAKSRRALAELDVMRLEREIARRSADGDEYE